LKNKILILLIIIFFLLVNTTYYWESKLGPYAMPATMLLAIIYFGFLLEFLRQIYLTIKEKFKDRTRIFTIVLLAATLTLTLLKPAGIIDYDKLQGDDVLVAQREGAANCMTIFKLKTNNQFSERIVCFGMKEIKGNYKLVNDTIYFENVNPGRGDDEFYKFAVIRQSEISKGKDRSDLVRYKDSSDTTGHELWISKNDLYKLTDKTPNH
jgi:hypothetical protein